MEMEAAFDVDDLSMAPLYSLKLTGAQRALLDWLEQTGALFTPVPVVVEEAVEELSVSESTVYEAIRRLSDLSLLIEDAGGAGYRINARYYWTANPRMRALVAAALADPPVTPDRRAKLPVRMSREEAHRRRVVRSV
ncbi:MULTISPECIES: MarR family transcriptional regulator [unclassified Streptomyces]|uniref:MarR family transcriptional regulator n=1 Tax=unclassified Streptomyces TaxID=2593676 RepID=UPI003646CBD7